MHGALNCLFADAPGRDLVRAGGLSGLGLTRTQGGLSSATAPDGTGIVTFGASIPRYTGPAQRLLTEGLRANLLLNSATLSTQSVTVTAQAYTLSFRGTGSVALSGTFTGSLAGTGVTDWVSLTFTPTAGTLTATVTGSVTEAQIEAGNYRSSWIPTTGASITRSQDLVNATLASLGIGDSGACTILMAILATNLGASGNQTVLHMDDGSTANRWTADLLTAATTLRAYGTAASVGTSIVSGTGLSASAVIRFGMAIDGTGRMACSINGGAATAVTGGPTSGLTTLRLGATSAGSGNFYGETGRLRLLPFVATDAALPGLVANLAA